MKLGIDPKNDYAFKRVFGSEEHVGVLIHLLNAVLKPEPGKQIVTVQILNPFTEPVVLDDKLAILDIKARDQSGKLFNIEMQMVLHPALESRFLYYWSRLYNSQLFSGEDYDKLRPVISICFLDSILFTQTDRCHLAFALMDEESKIVYSDHLQLHLFQLPNFLKGGKPTLGSSGKMALFFE